MGAESSPAPARPTKHLNSLTGIRAFAALYVFAAHYADMNDIVYPLARNGAIGVNVFFCLSGFIMAYTTRNPPTGWYWSFYLRRIARIIPAYWCSLIITIPHLIVNLESNVATTPFQAFMSFIGIQTWFRPQVFPWNPVGWSVQTELAFYLMFPLLYRFRAQLVKYWYLSVLWVAFDVVYAVAVADPLTETMFYRLPWIRVGEFACGIIAHELRHKVNFTLWPFFFGLVGLCIGLSYEWQAVVACAHGALTIPVCLMLVQLANDDESGKNTYLNRFLGSKHMVFLGEISYSFYLLHDVWRVLAAKLGYSVLFAPCTGPCYSFPYLAYSLVAATLLHVFVEMPFYNWAVKCLKRRAAARATMPVYVAPDTEVLIKEGDSTAIIIVEPAGTNGPLAIELKHLNPSRVSVSSEKEGRSASTSSLDGTTTPPCIDTATPSGQTTIHVAVASPTVH